MAMLGSIGLAAATPGLIWFFVWPGLGGRDLAAEARAHRFREDLYYRLAVVELVVPPLHEHREDVPALVAEFASRPS